MKKLAKTLLSGAAFSALSVVAAMAQQKHPAFRVTALHAGHAVSKTKQPCNPHLPTCTYTFLVYSYQPASAPPKTHLIYTFYKWNSSSNLCTIPKEKIKARRRSIYAKIGTTTETYSYGCSSGPTVFYGDTWTNKTGVAGETDQFESKLIGHFKHSGNKYKGVLDMTVEVFIE